MKQKTLRFSAFLFLCALVLSIVVSSALCIVRRPTITEHTFPISITYEFNGETFTIEDEYVCTFDEKSFKNTSYSRYYDGELAGRDDLSCGDYLIQSYEDGELIILTNLYASYQMGDPQYGDHYNEYHRREPYVAYYVFEDYMEYTDEEHLAPYGVRIVDWSYAEPIDNGFKFSHITPLRAINVLPLLGIALLTLLACIILVKRDRSRPLRALDKVSIVLNIAILLVPVPFLTIVSLFSEALGGSSSFLSDQLMFCVPAIIVYGVAASLCLRRKGYKKSSFLIQFAAFVPFALAMLLDQIF